MNFHCEVYAPKNYMSLPHDETQTQHSAQADAGNITLKHGAIFRLPVAYTCNVGHMRHPNHARARASVSGKLQGIAALCMGRDFFKHTRRQLTDAVS